MLSNILFALNFPAKVEYGKANAINSAEAKAIFLKPKKFRKGRAKKAARYLWVGVISLACKKQRNSF